MMQKLLGDVNNWLYVAEGHFRSDFSASFSPATFLWGVSIPDVNIGWPPAAEVKQTLRLRRNRTSGRWYVQMECAALNRGRCQYIFRRRSCLRQSIRRVPAIAFALPVSGCRIAAVGHDAEWPSVVFVKGWRIDSRYMEPRLYGCVSTAGRH